MWDRCTSNFNIICVCVTKQMIAKRVQQQAENCVQRNVLAGSAWNVKNLPDRKFNVAGVHVERSSVCTSRMQRRAPNLRVPWPVSKLNNPPFPGAQSGLLKGSTYRTAA
jgi:hypothetical protein